MPSVRQSPSVEWVAVRENSTAAESCHLKTSPPTIHPWKRSTGSTKTSQLYSTPAAPQESPKGNVPVPLLLHYRSHLSLLSEAYARRPVAHHPAFVPHERPDHIGNGGTLFWSQSDNAYRFQSCYFWQLISRYKATIFNYLGLMFPFLEMMAVTPEEQNNPCALPPVHRLT